MSKVETEIRQEASMPVQFSPAMKKKMYDRMEGNAAQQRLQRMTKHERVMQARDRNARDIHKDNQRRGLNTTFGDALKKATESAERVHRGE